MLLNVPRNVAVKVLYIVVVFVHFTKYYHQVKIGTTLSFSASTDQKYTVIDNKLHPPVGKHKPPPAQPPPPTKTAKNIPSLPSGVSIRPVTPGAVSRMSPVTSGRPALTSNTASRKSAPPPPSRTVRPDVSNFAPCSPFCPGNNHQTSRIISMISLTALTHQLVTHTLHCLFLSLFRCNWNS